MLLILLGITILPVILKLSNNELPLTCKVLPLILPSTLRLVSVPINVMLGCGSASIVPVIKLAIRLVAVTSNAAVALPAIVVVPTTLRLPELLTVAILLKLPVYISRNGATLALPYELACILPSENIKLPPELITTLPATMLAVVAILEVCGVPVFDATTTCVLATVKIFELTPTGTVLINKLPLIYNSCH